MIRLHKNLLVYCLVALQLLTPFLHAHLWGKDSFEKTQGLHIHYDAPDVTDTVFKKPTLKSDHSLEQSVGVLQGITGKQLTDPLPIPSSLWVVSLALCLALLISVIRPFNIYRSLGLLPPPRASP